MTSFQAALSDEHIAEVARLARAIWQEHYVSIVGQEQVDYMLEKFQSETAIAEQLAGAYEYYIVRCYGRSTGYMAIVPNTSDASLMLSKIYIVKSARGRGLGKQALGFVEDLCRQRGIKTIWLTVNKNNAHSIAWYVRMGFANAGPILQDIGGGFVMDDFKMTMPVA